MFVFSKYYWQDHFSVLVALKSLFAALGLLWGLVEAVAFFSEEIGNSLKSSGWAYVASAFVLAVIWTLIETRPTLFVAGQPRRTETAISLRVGDILQLDRDHAIVVSSNTKFALKVGTSSVQAQCLKKYFDNDKDRLGGLLQEQLRSVDADANGEYPIGTVARIKLQSGPKLYFLAVASKNELDKSVTTILNVNAALPELWKFLSLQGDVSRLAIPLFGTGRGMLATPREEVLDLIIKTYLSASAERRFCPSLTVAVSPNDHRRNNVSIETFSKILDYHCHFS